MARIPDDELERLKQEVSLQRLAESRGITLNRPDKGPIQSGVQRQRLLRPAVRHAQQADVPGQLPGCL